MIEQRDSVISASNKRSEYQDYLANLNSRARNTVVEASTNVYVCKFPSILHAVTIPAHQNVLSNTSEQPKPSHLRLNPWVAALVHPYAMLASLMGLPLVPKMKPLRGGSCCNSSLLSLVTNSWERMKNLFHHSNRGLLSWIGQMLIFPAFASAITCLLH